MVLYLRQCQLCCNVRHMPDLTTAPRRRLSKEARRAQLLASAERVFGEMGYAGTTMELIAAESGVTRPLLYEHFKSVDEIYAECVISARAELDRRLLTAALEPGEQVDRLRAGIDAYFTFVELHASGWDVLFGPSPAPNGAVGEMVRELRFDTAEQIATLFMAERPDFDPASAAAFAHAVSGAGEQLARWWRRHPDLPRSAVVDQMLAVVWTGLKQVVEEW